MVYNSPNFPTPIVINTWKTCQLAADLPKFSSPFASSVMIRQNFPPPNFSHVRYYRLIQMCVRVCMCACVCSIQCVHAHSSLITNHEYVHGIQQDGMNIISCNTIITGCDIDMLPQPTKPCV